MLYNIVVLKIKSNQGGLIMMNENVVKVLKANMWDLATCANGEPNVVRLVLKMLQKTENLL